VDGAAVVNAALSLGALVGVALSGGFMYWQVGRYAAPQVPRSLFDERTEFFAYTAGLFVGIPLALFLVFYLIALANGALVSATIDAGAVIGGTELAQWLLLRTSYFGRAESAAFYALGLRSGIGGLLALAAVTEYFSTAPPSVLGIVLVLVQSVALVIVQVASALLSVRGPARLGHLGGSPLAGGLFSLVGLFLIGVGLLVDAPSALLGATLAALGGAWVFRRLRDPVLGGLLPPALPRDVESGGGAEPTPYGRLTK
jgi:hypothetical protein